MLTRLNFKLQNPPKPLDLQGSVTDQLSQLQDYINQSGKLSYDQARSIQKYLDDLNEKGALTITANSLYSARGLQFPTAQGAAVADVNTLDDYAEGSSGSATLSPQAGAFTSASASYDYTKVGNTVRIQVAVVITTNGTASGVFDVNIPFAPNSQTAASALRDDFKTVSAFVFNNGGQGQFRFASLYDGTTYAGGTGRTVYGSAVFRI